MQKNDSSKVVSLQNTTARNNFLQHLTRLAAIEREVISDLVKQTDSEVLETRSRAHILGRSAWRIEVACDGEIWSRAEDKRKGQNKSTDSDSIKKIVKKHSDAIGCTPQTIYVNRRVSELIKTSQIKSGLNLDLLDQKGFYLAALSATEPVAALESFAEAKKAEPTFRVSDAFRMLEKSGKTTRNATKAAIESVRAREGTLEQRVALINHITIARKTILRDILPTCPSDQLKKDTWDPLLLDLDNALRDIFDEDAGNAMKKSWLAGNHSENELSLNTGFPLDIVHRIMLYLSDDFILVPRDSGSPVWHMVGQPLPAELRGSIDTTAKVSNIEDDD